MSLLSLDIEEGAITEDEANAIDSDPALYLDEFQDPFYQPIQPMGF